jgi:hypothetical protein
LPELQRGMIAVLTKSRAYLIKMRYLHLERVWDDSAPSTSSLWCAELVQGSHSRSFTTSLILLLSVVHHSSVLDSASAGGHT